MPQSDPQPPSDPEDPAAEPSAEPPVEPTGGPAGDRGVDAFGRPLDGDYRWDDSRTGKTVGSWSFTGEGHWSKRRKDKNQEAMEYYRERSKAPGVEEGGGIRAQYCQECDGVIPLEYDQRKPADTSQVQHCPHCGAEVNPRVRRMFNWVEIDQPPPSDLAVVLPWLGLILLVIVAVVLLVVLG